MAGNFKLEIVTPEAKAYSGEVDFVQLTGIDGEMGIFAGHMPLMTQLAAGEILVRHGAETLLLAVGDGFVQITGEQVAILTDMAVSADKIDEVAAEEALKRAQVRLSQKLSDEEEATVQAAITHATAQLKVKRAQRK
jgi:F-type H+-transporting ATPase subunit epsilon